MIIILIKRHFLYLSASATAQQRYYNDMGNCHPALLHRSSFHDHPFVVYPAVKHIISSGGLTQNLVEGYVYITS